MKKAVFCVLNSKYIHSSLAPWYLSAAVEEFCNAEIVTEVVEATVNELIEVIVDRIVASSPDFLSFSVYIWNRNKTFEVAEMVKRVLPNVKVAVGGPEVSYDVASVMENTCIDFVISGEGELPVSQLLDNLFSCGSENLDSILGLSYRDEEGNVHEGEPYISDEEPPSPYTQAYLASLNGRIAYLETSRGCPYNCAYCLSGRCGSVRFFDINRAKENFITLANSGAKTIKLVDRTFNADKKRAKELFLFIIENYGKTIPKSVCFHFEISGEILDEDTIAILNSAPIGAIQLEIGIQSYNKDTLHSINRKSDLEKLESGIKRVLDGENIHVHIDLIAGLPCENLDSFVSGFNRAYFLYADMLQLGFLKLLHGSPLREEKDKYVCEYSQTPPYEVISTSALSQADLERIHCVEFALDKLYNSGRFKRTLEMVLTDNICAPFDFFEKIGSYLKAEHKTNISLDECTNAVFSYLKQNSTLDLGALRDAMLLDRFETCATGFIPSSLRVEDKNLSRFKKALERQDEHKSIKGVKRVVGILYSKNTVAYVDYCEENILKNKSGKYIVKEVPVENLK